MSGKQVLTKSWWREPLLHFALLGALILAVDRALGPPVDESRIIDIGPELISELSSLFSTGRGRPPTTAELDPLIETWLRNELLYREGLALGVDRGDPMIRERVIHKMRLVVFNNLVIEEPGEEQLREWFEANRDRYSKPRRISFALARFRGSAIESRAAALEVAGAASMGPDKDTNSDRDDQEAPYEIQVTGFQERPQGNLVELFGEAFVDALLSQPAKEWQAVQGKERWHAVRVEKILPAADLEFDQVRGLVQNDWHTEERRRLAKEATEEIRQSYLVRREAAE